MDKRSKQKKAVWVDLLCWGSAFKIIQCARSQAIEKIHYVSVTNSFERFIPWLERTTGVGCVCVDDTVECETKMQGLSLYEMIQKRITDIFSIWVGGKSVNQFGEKFCGSNGFDPSKFEAHIKEAAYPHIFRAVEMGVLAEHAYGPGNFILVVRRTPFKRSLKLFLGAKHLCFYRTFFSHRMAIKARKDYYYDKHFNPIYFRDRFSTVMHFFMIWLFNSISALVNLRPYKNSDPAAVILGVELSQSRQRPDEINDLAWFEGSGIDSKHVRTLEFSNYDEESVSFIRSLGIGRCKVIQFPSQLIKCFQMLGRDADVIYLTAPATFGFVTFMQAVSTLRSLFMWDERGWLRFQAAKYACRSFFWKSIYQRTGIRIVVTMFDVDEDKLAKGQAVELLGGLIAGGHWSNFPMHRIDNQKCLDVIMTWGEHFVKNNFQQSPFMAIFIVGYPCDYYFKMHREGASVIRQRHEGKFIISYHDNIMANDLPYSKGMQIEIHQMLLSVLRKFENVVVFLKPKRRFVLDEIFKLLPDLAYYLREGRLEVFLGDTPRTKAVPAEIGMASDLVIGLGISTTAAEAYLAGTISFHADFTGFDRNEFGNRGQNVIVFKDIFSLEKAVIERIQKKSPWSYEDYRGYYTTLDPFQDGCASKRIGFILKRMREYLAQGAGRYELLEKVRNDYDVYLSSMERLFGISLN